MGETTSRSGAWTLGLDYWTWTIIVHELPDTPICIYYISYMPGFLYLLSAKRSESNPISLTLISSRKVGPITILSHSYGFVNRTYALRQGILKVKYWMPNPSAGSNFLVAKPVNPRKATFLVLFSHNLREGDRFTV